MTKHRQAERQGNGKGMKMADEPVVVMNLEPGKFW